jgi:hypothetical protein
MNATRDPDRTLAAWLDEGPTDLPDATRRAILTALPTTRQARRGLLAPWRLPSTNTYSRLAAAAVVAVIAIGGALYLLGPSREPGQGGPSPSPSPSAVPFPTLPLDTTTWIAYPVSRYGYIRAHPSGWQGVAATEDWAGQTSYDMWVSAANAPWADKSFSSTWNITMTALAATIPDGTSPDSFISSYLAPPEGPTPTCFGIEPNDVPIVIDGHPARRTANCGDQTDALSAFVVVDNRLFVFGISDGKNVELFDAYLSTIVLPTPAPAAS